MITIVAESGLCNRMRVVASVLKNADLFQEKVHLVWQPAWNCNARFEDLFERVEIPGIKFDEGNIIDTPATKENLWLPLLLRKFHNTIEKRCFQPKEDFSLQDWSKIKRPLFINTCYALGSYEPSDLRRYFRPVPALKRRVEEVAALFTDKTIGVHIRRTDNTKAITNSPLSAFCERIDALIEEHIESIFLSTDDEQVRAYFRQRYGKRVITRRVCLNRDSLIGVQDAVIDLWCLAHTSYILGSYYSSFSDTAGELSNVPIEIIRVKSAIN